MVSIGILGCGNIAGILAARYTGIAEIIACYDIDKPRMKAFAQRVGAKMCRDVESLLGHDYPVLVEVASVEAVQQNLPRALAITDKSELQCVFRGKASEAVRLFPRNINVSAALGLATWVEPDVELWADPAVTSNRHEIEAIGEFGRVTICTENLPSPDNPATSYLAALSVLALLANLDDPIRVGT
jgi:aspartate dehydrogenase